MKTAQDSGPAARARRLPATPRWWNEETRFGWLAIAPAIAFFSFFVGFPVCYSFYLSFHDWNMMSPTPYWVGFENYTSLIGTRSSGAA